MVGIVRETGIWAEDFVTPYNRIGYQLDAGQLARLREKNPTLAASVATNPENPGGILWAKEKVDHLATLQGQYELEALIK